MIIFFFSWNPIMCNCVISQSLQRFGAPVNTIKMCCFNMKLDYAFVWLEVINHLVISVIMNSRFEKSAFMAQSDVAKSAEADYIFRVWLGNNKV